MSKRKHRSPSDIRHRARKREAKVAQHVAQIASDIPVPDAACVDCSATTHRITTGVEIYPHRPDLAHKRFLICACGAYVGFHAGTDIPLGRPAGRITQRARRAAHDDLDRLWQAKMRRDACPKNVARGTAYKWLAEQLGIEPRTCHIGWMTAEEARRVSTICRPYLAVPA